MTDPSAGLSARERQVMDIVYRLREATATDVEVEMTRPPTNATVRSILRTLEAKGHLTHGRSGATFVYRPVRPREAAKRGALSHVVRTFFDGSAADAVAALVGRGDGLSEAERDRVSQVLRSLEAEDES